MKDDFNSYALRGLADAVEDALQSDCTPDEILDCFLSSIKNPAGSIMSTGIPRQAPSLNIFPVFCGMSGSKRAILMFFYYIIFLLASRWHIFKKYFFE